MSLPADIARCRGVGYAENEAGDWSWREGCEHCKRRTVEDHPARRVAHMEPPAVIAFECEYLIPGESNG